MEKLTLPTLQIYSFVEPPHFDNYLPQCHLKWRQGQLFVSLGQQSQQPYISAFDSEQQLVECLKHSSVRIVRLDPMLGEAVLQRWVDACEKANKSVFLRVTNAQKLSRMTRKQNQFCRQLKQPINWIAAFLLLIALSPVMVAIAILMYLYSPEPIFSKQWHIDPRGKLFRLFKFRTTIVNDNSPNSALIPWMCKYKVDELPQLLNVLRGEINLMDSSYPPTVAEEVGFGLEGQQHLSTLLEITEAQIIENDLKELDLGGYKQ